MRITDSSVSLQAGHTFSRVEEARESLRLRLASPPASGRGAGRIPGPGRGAIQPHAASKAPEAVERPPEANKPCGPEKAGRPDLARLKSLVEKLVEMVTGRRIRIRTAELSPGGQGSVEEGDAGGGPGRAGPAQSARGGWGLEYEFARYERESETTSFSAAGVVRTADGGEFAFRLELVMHREYEHYESARLRVGEAAVSDPLVLNLDGSAARLSGLRFALVRTADGVAEDVPMLEAGSGFLVLDLDGDGSVTSGREMFGPLSGDGFAELAAHDMDGNNWIDEADPVFRDLRVWVKDGDEDSMLSLTDLGIGAIFLGRVGTPFSLTDPGNQLLGRVRSSGLYLRENGTAGAVQQLDMSL